MTIVLPALYDSLKDKQIARVREEYRRLQKDKCWYCGRTLQRNMYPVKHPVHLHHSHTTGLTIGAVHEYCNMILRLRKDDEPKPRHESVIKCFANVAFASCRFCEWSRTVWSKRDVTSRAWVLVRRHIATAHPKRNR